MGLSFNFGPCIATTATNRADGYGSLSDLVSNYQHETSTVAGFDNASITLTAPWWRLQEWWQNGIGRDILISNPDLDTAWRGFANSLALSIGPLSATRGPLIDILNQAYVIYSRILDDSVSPPIVGNATLTTIAQDTDSIALYGQWEKVLTGGTSTPTRAEQYRDTEIQDKRLPIVSKDLNLQANQTVQLTINCLGYWAWLKAFIYSDATAGTRTITDKITDVLAADTNGIFSTDYSYIETNAFLASREESDSAFADTVIQSEVKVGDVNDNPYRFGIYEDQVARYRNIIDLPTAYEHFMHDEAIRINEYGGKSEVDYWNVRADEWIFVDFEEGERPDTVDRRNDNRFIFAERVRYSIPDSLSINGMEINTLDQFLAKGGRG
jgi:hypothetical protein